MRWLIILVALAGVVAAVLARKEHYRVGESPCSINEKWDCGTVNKSPFAVIGGILQPPGPDTQPEQKGLRGAINSIPVADIGIAGYILLILLAFKRWWYALAPVAVGGLVFSLYLAHIEKDVLGVWCIYCVISLAAISLLTVLAVIMAFIQLARQRKTPGQVSD